MSSRLDESGRRSTTALPSATLTRRDAPVKPGCESSAVTRLLRIGALLAALALLAGCGSGTTHPRTATPFDYDASRPLGYVDRGRVDAGAPVAVHDVSFRSQGRRIDGYLALPGGDARRPAVVVVHGSGGDRSELLGSAVRLAERGIAALTVTEPSTAYPPLPAVGAAIIEQQRDIAVHDVVAVRRAVDLLRSLPSVDPARIGYLGWSAGAKTGALLAAADPRVSALALLSAGADPLSAFVANAPVSLRGRVRRVLGSVDPIAGIARARPGAVLLEDGRRDEIVPRAALRNVVRAAPKGTTVRWYPAGHALNERAYEDAIAWLVGKLRAR
jgi:dienelactone hydrolase